MIETARSGSGNAESKPRVLVVVGGGVADPIYDDGVDVEVFDWDNYRDDPEGTGPASARFADLAESCGVPFEGKPNTDTAGSAGKKMDPHTFEHPVIGQEAVCRDGLGRVTAFKDEFPTQWIEAQTYVNNRSCHWDPANVRLVPIK